MRGISLFHILHTNIQLFKKTPQHGLSSSKRQRDRPRIGTVVLLHTLKLESRCNETHTLTVSDARFKHKEGAGLSQDVRKSQGLELTPEEEQLLAGQVHMLCVCTPMMLIVYAWVQVLMTIFTCCAGKMHVGPSGANTRKALG